MDTQFLRPTVPTPKQMRSERWMYADFVMHCAQTMKPRAKNRMAENGTVIEDAKPPSALGPMYGWRRMLRATHILPDTAAVRGVLKGLIAIFKKKYGPRALIPQRRAPFTQPMLHAIDGAINARRLAGWSEEQCLALQAAFKYGLATGDRAEALTSTFDGDADFQVPRQSQSDIVAPS